MNDLINIEQKSAFGSETTQIATQNNYNGLSPQDACKVVIDLFYDNFPKLQKEANVIVEKRVTELMNEIASKLMKNNVTDMSPLADPDVQYIVYEAQKGYARFATEELLSTLSSLVSERVKQHDADLCLKVAIDQAITIAPMLSQEHLNYLSLLFIVKHTKIKGVVDISSMELWLNSLNDSFHINCEDAILHLDALGCLRISLGKSCQVLSRIYGIQESEIEKICPDNIKMLHGDYGTSNIGTILAILNAENKIDVKFNPTTWIHS